MLLIKFQNGNSTRAEFHKIKPTVVELIGENVENLSGFEAWRSDGSLKIGDYTAFTTKYNIYTEIEGGIRLSTGEVEDEPIVEEETTEEVEEKTSAKVIFLADSNCHLEGDTEFTVAINSDSTDILVPEVVIDDAQYEFIGWTPSLPEKITDDITLTAVTSLLPAYTVEGRLATLEECILELADVVYAE